MFSKRLFFSIAFLHSLLAGSFSQKFYSIGAGGNIFNVSSIGKEVYNTKYGFHFSAGAEKIFSDPLGIRLELIFNTKQISSLLVENSVSREYKFFNDIEMSTIGIPVLATLHFKHFIVETGPYFDFLLHSKQKERELIYYYYGSYYDEKIFYDRQSINNPEIGFILGLKIPVYRNIDISARYAQGFTPIGREYLWTRLNMLQFSTVIQFGDKFSPSRVKPIPKNRETSDAPIQYQTTASSHITRIDYSKVAPGNRIYFRIRSSDFSTVFISDFTIQGTSGSVIVTGTEKAINDVIFPFQGVIRYTVTNSLSKSSYESYLEFRINESGIWEIGLINN